MDRATARFAVAVCTAWLCACGGTVSGTEAGSTDAGGNSALGGSGGAADGGGSGGVAGLGGSIGGSAGTAGSGQTCTDVMPGICCDKLGDAVDPVCSPSLGGMRWDCPSYAPHVDASECPAVVCKPSVPCPPELWCDYGSNLCGQEDEQGTCKPKPDGCPGIYQPACGCDGVAHGNECEAQAAGWDVSSLEMCEPPQPGIFPCGQLFCDAATSFCQVLPSDVIGSPPLVWCMPLPASCSLSAPDCACLQGASCAGSCWWNATQWGGYRVVCEGA